MLSRRIRARLALSSERRTKENEMNWKQKTVVRILMIVARMVAEDEWLKDELKNLANHISIGTISTS
jgi:hypothetical protein